MLIRLTCQARGIETKREGPDEWISSGMESDRDLVANWWRDVIGP